jgi:hypothetical protein
MFCDILGNILNKIFYFMKKNYFFIYFFLPLALLGEVAIEISDEKAQSVINQKGQLQGAKEKIIKKKCKVLKCRPGVEYYEKALFDLAYNSINKEHLEKYSISDFYNRKSSTLNFFEALAFYLFSMEDKNYNRYIIYCLERLYVLCPQNRMKELLLWNLIVEYERQGKHRVASELANQFKTFFPGSSFYWAARYREIKNGYEFCEQEYHDMADTQKILKLCEEFIFDSTILAEPFFMEVLYIYQDLSLRIVNKNIEIIDHYLQKYKYTFEEGTSLSVLLRLNRLLEIVTEFSEIQVEKMVADKKYILYQSVLKKIKDDISSFFEVFSYLKMPSGLEYPTEHDAVMDGIKKHSRKIREKAEYINNNIRYAIQNYYEIKV